MSSRPLPFASVLLALLLFASPAFAWVEMHVSAYEARIELSRQGTAKIDNTLRFRVGGGPLRTFDVKIADRNVTLPEDATLANARDGIAAAEPVPVRLEQRPDGDVRVDIDGRKGVGRGVYELRFAYTIDLLRSEQISLDGSMLKVVWTSPQLDDGIDNMKVTMLVPSAATEPRVASLRIGSGEDSSFQEAGAFLSALSRAAQYDELSLVRPYVARKEAVAWAVRIDPKALGEVSDPRLRPQVAETVESAGPVQPKRRAIGLVIIAAGAVLYGLLLALKHREVVRTAGERGVTPRPLAPVGIVVRVTLAGPMLAGGIAWQMLAHDPLPGSLVILGALLLTVYLPARKAAQPRGPGRWLPLSRSDAFCGCGERPAWFDIGSVRGKVAFAATLLSVVAGIAWLSRWAPYQAHLVAIDSTVLLALWGTGLRRWLPGDAVRSAAPLLGRVCKALAKSELRVGIVGRVPTGASKPDELRLSVRPRSTLRGFIGLEVGVGWFHGAGGALAVPEVLVRVAEGSECHDAMTARMAGAHWVRGRDAHERVLVLTPALPTSDGVSALVRKLGTWVVTAPAPQQTASTRRAQPRSAASIKARRSSGRAASTSKPAMEAVPLQAR